MPTTTITPSAQSNISAVFTFYTGDTGAFSLATVDAGGAIAAADSCLNSLKVSGGNETADFSCGQDIVTLHRLVKEDWTLSGSMNLRHPMAFWKQHATAGPLVQCVVTITNPSAGSTSFVATYKGLMLKPDVDLVNTKGPGTVDFTIKAYGITPTFTWGA